MNHIISRGCNVLHSVFICIFTLYRSCNLIYCSCNLIYDALTKNYIMYNNYYNEQSCELKHCSRVYCFLARERIDVTLDSRNFTKSLQTVLKIWIYWQFVFLPILESKVLYPHLKMLYRNISRNERKQEPRCGQKNWSKFSMI